MLQDIRKSSQGTAAKVIIGVIVLSFAAFGIESILVGGGSSGIAEVNGEQIYPGEVEQLVNTQKRRIISMMGENMDPAMLDDERLTAQALESIIGRKLQMQEAAALKLTISNKQISGVVASMEQFQLDGQFSPDMYKSLLSGAGYTPESFKRGLAEDLLLNQISSGLAGSDFATQAELALNATYSAESRDVRYLTIPLEKFTADMEVGDEQIEQYYSDNEQAFYTPETVELDFVELSLEDFKQAVEEETLLEQYELEKENNEYQTESGVAHILFEQGEEETDEAFQGRIATAQKSLTEGADFGELAKTASDDIGSASYGGELGFTQGDTFPEEMEDAIAALEVGAVSTPVETDAGVHLIKLTERRDGEVPPFEEMRAALESRVQTQEARKELTRVVEELKDLAFNAEDLSSPAQELALEVQRSDAVSRSQQEGLFANQTLLTAAFSDEVLAQGHNSDVIEVTSDSFVVLRVRTHNEPEVKPLELVKGEIVARITDETARASVREAADQILAQLHAGTGLEQLANESGYDWQVELAADRQNPMLPQSVLQRVFQLPAPAVEGESSYDYVLTATGDVQVFELVRVTPGSLATLEPTQRDALQGQITSEYGRMVGSEFQNGLRESADVTIL
ncbi:MAG: SurA N-terminal domain-containing protein [Halioglobus sp.]